MADLVKHHVITLKSVVDAQAAKDQAGAYTAMRAAAGHMQMIADPLAVAIVKQFPIASPPARSSRAAGSSSGAPDAFRAPDRHVTGNPVLVRVLDFDRRVRD